MTRLWKGLALLVAIACVVWVAVLWRWQATARDMSTGDIVVYLGLLPLASFAFVLMARWAWQGASERASRQAAASAVATAEPARAPAVDEGERLRTVQLIAAHITTAAAETPADLLAAARDGQPRPELDAELRDDDGMPVVAARVAVMDGAAVEEASAPLLQSLRAGRAEWGSAEVRPHVWRALAGLQLPLAAAVASLAPWQPALAGTTAHKPESPAERSVRVLLGWPLGWSEFEQEAARAAASAWVAEEAAACLPGVRVTISAQAIGGDALVLQADRLMLTLARASHDEPLIVAACHSDIGDQAVAALEHEALLFHPQRRPKGQMPAEAAAALVLAGADWPAAPDDNAVVPHLHRPAAARRDKSVDAPGRVAAQTAALAWSSALGTSGLEAGAVMALVGDADQHTERAAEFYVVAADALPHLETTEDVHAIGHVLGAVGGVGSLLVIACAAAAARAAQAPCGALSLGDGFSRLAIVVRPSRPEAAPAGPATAAANP